ncbi:GNAT family N-acetyltransferase [Derxia lacustris]|uniref:GNAT family N-acetyltransferase n=1 Tax=Derxia lacustris TaxID=764842 RepID=UPI000A16F080|nr:GNAT family N-acetyltransferase [Derxia lacustris]
MTPTPPHIALERPDRPDIVALLDRLDAYLDALYPPEANYILDIARLCQPDVLFAVARDGAGIAFGCAAIRLHADYAELKRMFVLPERRGGGVARRLIGFLEAAARERGLKLLRLETGIHQPEALALYRAAGFVPRGPFGDYPELDLSVFMEKPLAD